MLLRYFNPILEYLLSESQVSMNVWNGTLLEVTIDRTADYRQLKVSFQITISDIGQAVRAKPG